MEEIRFIEQRESDTQLIAGLLAQGQLPLRVTHNDTKLNNVLFDVKTGEGICVLDLDTVMPGLVLSDFGDMVRSAAATTTEDDPERSRAGISLEAFASLARGYLDELRLYLSQAEIDLLAFSARQITLEQGIRFLTDYLNGDIYYKIQRPAHNLERARNQMAMLVDMEKKYTDMVSIVSQFAL